MITIDQDQMNAALEAAKTPDSRVGVAGLLDAMKQVRSIDVSQNIFMKGDRFSIPAMNEIEKYVVEDVYTNLPKRRNPKTGKDEYPMGYCVLVQVENNGNRRIARFRPSAVTKTITQYAKDPVNETFIATGEIISWDNELTRTLKKYNNPYDQLKAMSGHTFEVGEEKAGNAGVFENRRCVDIRRTTCHEFKQVELSST